MRVVRALDRAVAAARDCPTDSGMTATPMPPAHEPAATILEPELARQREHRRPAHPRLPVSPPQAVSH